MQEARTRRAAAGIAMLMHYTAHGSRQLRRHQPHVLVTATRADALRHSCHVDLQPSRLFSEPHVRAGAGDGNRTRVASLEGNPSTRSGTSTSDDAHTDVH